jgi:hypothetical protein
MEIVSNQRFEARANRRDRTGQRLGVQWFLKNFRKMVAQIYPRWNPLTSWMRQIEDFQRAA